MKPLFLMVATAATMAAWGQSALGTRKPVNGVQANSNQPATVWVQGVDGSKRELQVPATIDQSQTQRLVQRQALLIWEIWRAIKMGVLSGL